MIYPGIVLGVVLIALGVIFNLPYVAPIGGLILFVAVVFWIIGGVRAERPPRG